MKPSELIKLLENPEAPKKVQRDEPTELLLTLLVHLVVADRRVDERELKLISRILPDGQDARGYIEELSKRELDLDRLAALFPNPKDRDDIVTLAEHGVWGDDEVDPREWDIVDKVVEKLGVTRD
ncbi:MAG: TerB family tellurite resistance protein [Polyangiales bacterium]